LGGSKGNVTHAKTSHALYQKGQKVIGSALSLAHQFREDSTIQHHFVQLGNGLSIIDDTRSILATGKLVGERKVARVLGVTNGQSEETGQREESASTMFFDGKEGDRTWASVAKKQFKAVQRLVKKTLLE
jgi:hypothetical protein